MELTDEEKMKIYEEEKARIEAREKAKKDIKAKKQTRGCLGCLGVVVLLVVVGSIVGGTNGGGKKESTQPTPTPTKSAEQLAQERARQEEEHQRTVESLAATFCEERQGQYSYGIFFCNCVDLDSIIELLESSGPVTIRNAGKPPTEESCRRVSELCLKVWDKEDCKSMAERKIWLGMTKEQLYISWGVPRDKNDTVGSWGVHSQWVYGDFGPYVYLEGKSKDNLVVTSWQD